MSTTKFRPGFLLFISSFLGILLLVLGLLAPAPVSAAHSAAMRRPRVPLRSHCWARWRGVGTSQDRAGKLDRHRISLVTPSQIHELVNVAASQGAPAKLHDTACAFTEQCILALERTARQIRMMRIAGRGLNPPTAAGDDPDALSRAL